MKKKQMWVALFSQSGSELRAICQQIKRSPDLIICNSKQDIDFNQFDCKNVIKVRGTKNDDNFYSDIMNAFNIESQDCILTCHGWLRIIPPATCLKYQIFNGHPGDIVKYPELKGKDPQQKAFDMKLTHSGTVIHRVTADVDAGPIVMHDAVKIVECKTVDQVIDKLKKQSIKQWIKLLNTLL